MKVRYKHNKELMTVLLPIGMLQPRSAKGKIEFHQNEPVEMSDADAKALVALDPNNFEIVESKKQAKSE